MKRLETELTKAVADLRVSLNTHPWMRESKGELLESLEHSLLLLRIDGLRAKNAELVAAKTTLKVNYLS